MRAANTLSSRVDHNEIAPGSTDADQWKGRQGRGSTEFFDQFDYISDNPANMLAAPFFATHDDFGGERRSPGVLLSLRDPARWARSRIAHHAAQGAANDWRASNQCLGYGPTLGAIERGGEEARALCRSVMTWNAWAACLATSAAYGYDRLNNLLMFNLFQEGQSDAAIDAAFARNLSAFLLGRASCQKYLPPPFHRLHSLGSWPQGRRATGGVPRSQPVLAPRRPPFATMTALFPTARSNQPASPSALQR